MYFSRPLHLVRLDNAFRLIYNTAVKSSLQLRRVITEKLTELQILCV